MTLKQVCLAVLAFCVLWSPMLLLWIADRLRRR